MSRKFWVSVSAILALSGCANSNSIWRDKVLLRDKEGVAVASMDARQRTLIASRDDHRLEGSALQYCAEQAPDIFAVLASSMRGDGELTLTTAQRTASANLAAAMSESASTISRTQSLNLITQLLYRTCEAGLNGRVSNVEMVGLLRQSQRLVTSMMAIEQLTSLGRPQQSATLTAGLASVFGDERAGERLEATFQNHAKAVSDKKAAEDALRLALAKAPEPTPPAQRSCAAITAEADKKACTDAEAKLATTTAAEKSLREHYAALAALVKLSGVSAGAEPVGPSGGSNSMTISDNSISVIANRVLDLAKLAGSADEIDTVCDWLSSAEGPESGRESFPKLWINCRQRASDRAGSLVATVPQEAAAIVAENKSATSPTGSAGANVDVAGRIFIQVATDAQRRQLATLPSALRPMFPRARIASELDLEATNSPFATEVRYFAPSGQAAAELVAAKLQIELRKTKPSATAETRDFSTYGRTRNISPDQLEIWIGSSFQ